MFQGFSDITGHTGNHLYNKFSELLRGRPGVRIPFGAPDNNAESLYFQRFSAFLFFAVVDGLLIANHRFGILWSRSITFSVFSQLAFC